MHKRFRKVIEFMSHSLCRLSLQKKLNYIFFCSKLVPYKPLASTNIPSKGELVIMSAKLFALYFAAIRDLWYNLAITCLDLSHISCNNLWFHGLLKFVLWICLELCREYICDVYLDYHGLHFQNFILIKYHEFEFVRFFGLLLVSIFQ